MQLLKSTIFQQLQSTVDSSCITSVWKVLDVLIRFSLLFSFKNIHQNSKLSRLVCNFLTIFPAINLSLRRLTSGLLHVFACPPAFSLKVELIVSSYFLNPFFTFSLFFFQYHSFLHFSPTSQLSLWKCKKPSRSGVRVSIKQILHVIITVILDKWHRGNNQWSYQTVKLHWHLFKGAT